MVGSTCWELLRMLSVGAYAAARLTPRFDLRRGS